jgi:hypothetical protein
MLAIIQDEQKHTNNKFDKSWSLHGFATVQLSFMWIEHGILLT